MKRATRGRRHRAYTRRRFKSRTARARAAQVERAKKLWAKRIRMAAAILVTLMQAHGTPALESWVAVVPQFEILPPFARAELIAILGSWQNIVPIARATLVS